jgi:hypothetical protein
LINNFDANYGLTPPSDSTMEYLSRNVVGPRANHMADADAAMRLTPEEKYLYNTHLSNLNGPGKVVHPMGDISSLYQMSFERDGKIYNIPTIWGGKALPPGDAVKAAEATGLEKFPAYDTPEEAEGRYGQMHDYLAKDTNDFRGQR